MRTRVRLRRLAAAGTSTTLLTAGLAVLAVLAPPAANGAVPDPGNLVVHYDFAGDPLAAVSSPTAAATDWTALSSTRRPRSSFRAPTAPPP